MTFSTFIRTVLATVMLGLVSVVHAEPADLDAELLTIQQEWAVANYEIAAADKREQALEALSKRAEAFSARYPQRAEPLIWEGIVLSTYAGARGGLGALGVAKRSRAKLEAAIAIDPRALDGSGLTSLGTLYYKVPGFPVGFGNHDKARKYLEQSLAINPNGIDPNYFYGEFLYEEGDKAGAIEHLEQALKAAPRPHRELADAGRRREIEALMGRIRKG